MRRRSSRTPRATEPPSRSEPTRRYETIRGAAAERVPPAAAGLGPYEAQYDVALGYTEDRSITVR